MARGRRRRGRTDEPLIVPDAPIFNSCTTIDHIYPGTVSGTPCHCGARRWNQDSPFYRNEYDPPRQGRKTLVLRTSKVAMVQPDPPEEEEEIGAMHWHECLQCHHSWGCIRPGCEEGQSWSTRVGSLCGRCRDEGYTLERDEPDPPPKKLTLKRTRR